MAAKNERDQTFHSFHPFSLRHSRSLSLIRCHQPEAMDWHSQLFLVPNYKSSSLEVGRSLYSMALFALFVSLSSSKAKRNKSR